MKGIRDAVYGVAVGDALGSPVQFMARDSFPHVSEMTYCNIFNKPAGTWTDDTSLTLALCDSIREKGNVDINDIRERFRSWLFCGKYTQDGIAFDVGNTCRSAIVTGEGKKDIYSNGNGSLMRIIPLVFIGSNKDIENVSAITHAHAISRSACCNYVHIGRMILLGKSVSESIGAVMGKEYLDDLIKTERKDVRSSGFVLDTLDASLWCLTKTNSFRDAVELAVNLGDDADTVGAVTGGLAGILYGYDAIPASWIGAIRKKELIEGVLK